MKTKTPQTRPHAVADRAVVDVAFRAAGAKGSGLPVSWAGRDRLAAAYEASAQLPTFDVVMTGVIGTAGIRTWSPPV